MAVGQLHGNRRRRRRDADRRRAERARGHHPSRRTDQRAADEPQRQQPARTDARHLEPIHDADVAGPFGAPGVCVGGIGVFCNPGINGFNVGDRGRPRSDNMAQGRVIVDGQVVNQGGSTAARRHDRRLYGRHRQLAGSQHPACRARSANPRPAARRSTSCRAPAATVRRQLQHDLHHGELVLHQQRRLSEPSGVFQPVKNDHDVSVDFGGPILKDKLWFYSVGRDQGIHKLPVGVDFWPNLWEGQVRLQLPARSQQAPRRVHEHVAQRATRRITWQASAKNKFNFFWDEQDFCQDPCTASSRSSRRPSRGSRSDQAGPSAAGCRGPIR